MTNELESAAERYAVFACQVLQPAVYPARSALKVAAFQCAAPVGYDQAVQAAYEPVAIGWRWGPAWSTAWFRICGRVPPAMAGKCVVLRFSSGTEALLWDDGAPRQGFDPNRDAVTLYDRAEGGEEVRLHVEAACNNPFGIATFQPPESEDSRRWSGSKPGRLERCELAVYDAMAWRLWRTYEFARQLLLVSADESARGQQLNDALRRATEGIDDTDVPATGTAALAILEEVLRANATDAATCCYASGHAHIDTAWLWPICETKRKCLRTFANVLGLMDRYPEFSFLCSQAQQYAWVEHASPKLFARVAQRVREGRWEAGGAMWIEPDCNVPSGESLVRQILLGTRYWQQRFGEQGQQRFLYLPDTFGFPASLPQITALAGLDTFITNKLATNESNEFPLVNFRWRGIDGTEILAHCTPGHDYTATNTPAELQRGERNAARKDQARSEVWLQPFGFGDGGGGPTDWMIHNALLARECAGLPNVTLARADAFCEELRRRRVALRTEGRDLPVWDGELYLEYHRGTYTTQAWLKQANRRAEQALRVAEWLAFAGPAPLEAQRTAAVQSSLHEAWPLVLLNQFHDILPGSSILAVYEDARRQHERVREICDALIDEGVHRWADSADTGGLQAPLIVFNPTCAARSAVVECEGRVHYVKDVPALGAAVMDRSEETDVAPACVRDRTLSNGIVEATISAAGSLTSLKRVGCERDACVRRADGSPEPLNQLVLYEDRPRAWEAWELNAEYEEKAYPLESPAESWRVVEDGPLRAAIEVAHPLGQNSHITQRIVLEAGSPCLDVHTRVEWHESRRLLRALFPVDVRARRATYEIQFGHIERPTHRNTSWERAMFEVCAHGWMDLSEPGFGVALLNDCKYGHSCHENVMGISLLRSPKFPDPEADMGAHEFTYSLMVHDGDWRAAGVDREAEALNTPLMARPLSAGQAGPLAGAWTPFTLVADGAANVVVSAVKRAEDDDRLIIRLVETHGGRGRVTIAWNLPVRMVEPVDLLERPLHVDGFGHDAAVRRTTVPLRPFQIVTLAVRQT